MKSSHVVHNHLPTTNITITLLSGRCLHYITILTLYLEYGTIITTHYIFIDKIILSSVSIYLKFYLDEKSHIQIFQYYNGTSGSFVHQQNRGYVPPFCIYIVKNLTTKIIQLIAFYKAYSLFSPREQIPRKIRFQFCYQPNPLCKGTPEGEYPVTVPEEVLYGFRFTVAKKKSSWSLRPIFINNTFVPIVLWNILYWKLLSLPKELFIGICKPFFHNSRSSIYLNFITWWKLIIFAKYFLMKEIIVFEI